MNHIKKLVRIALVSAALSALFLVGASAQGIGTAVVYDDGLRLRAEASRSSAVLTHAYKDEVVAVLEDAGDNWYRVSYKGQEGYMSGAHLIITWNETAPAEKEAPVQQAPAEADTEYGRVTAGPLNVRSTPGTAGKKAGTLCVGAVVEILGRQDGWYQIAYNGSDAWICADYVKAGIDPDEITVGQQAVDLAMQYLGCKYVYGAEGPTKFDCSGLTMYVYGKLGYQLNRSAAGQTQDGTYVSRAQLQVGDLVLFRHADTTKAASHVGFYIGDGQFLHASTNGYRVRIDNLDSKWYSGIFIGGRHIA